MFGSKCNHKYGEVKPDGYQYCNNCGIATPAPLKLCSHKWKIHTKNEVVSQYSGGGIIRCIYLMQCEHCGETKQETVKTY